MHLTINCNIKIKILLELFGENFDMLNIDPRKFTIILEKMNESWFSISRLEIAIYDQRADFRETFSWRFNNIKSVFFLPKYIRDDRNNSHHESYGKYSFVFKESEHMYVLEK